MSRRAICLGLVLCCACSSPTKPAPETPSRTTSAQTAPETPPPPTLPAFNAALAEEGVTETIAGLPVEDPFRALEADTPRTRAWIEAQSRATLETLAPYRDPAAEARLAELLAIGSLGSVQLAGSKLFFMLREADRERPALFMHDLARSGPVVPEAPILDPLDYGPNAAIDYAVASHDGAYVAFGVSDKGDERATLRVYDVAQDKVLSDAIPHAKWSSIDWLSDSRGFYYTRYPKQGEPDYDPDRLDSYFPRVFFHALGTDPDQDARLFSGTEPVDFPGANLDETDRYVVINNHRSWTASDVWLWDRGAKAKGRPAVPAGDAFVPVVRGRDDSSYGLVHRGRLYLVTNIDAPKKRIVRAPPGRAADPARWETLIPESDGRIEDVVFTRNHIVVHGIHDVRSKLRVFDLAGESSGEIELPMAGSVSALSGARDGDRLAFVWSSFFHPPTLFLYDLRERRLRELYRVRSPFDASAFELVQRTAASRDGTPINFYYGQRRGAAPSGDAPVLIHGYGGFDISLLPTFTRSALYWLERGGIYAEANLRGGGEFGETWHRAGMLRNKHNVFDDFEAVIRWFATSGLSKPERIAITGGSNGGLLVGALLTRAPDAFAAAASYVGLYDMLRYPMFPPAALWTSEYGDPEDPELARYLLSYSPYHNVRSGVRYPATLIETADHDTRVFWGHSAKFAARLQTANGGPNPILFYMERAVGHGRGTSLADLVKRQARQAAFLSLALGLPAAPHAGSESNPKLP